MHHPQAGPIAGAAGFPNRLVVGPAAPLPRRPAVLALLLLACLLPRAWAAWRSDLLWTDSINYHYASEALAEGRLDDAFRELGLNIYPVMLGGLRAAGLDWTVAGMWLSVAVASLAVLPLFGWVRRQFDDRVAIVACLLYAAHGKLVAISCLVIRDPTFWLLFLLTLYCLWRAAVEVRWRWYVVAGIGLTLIVHLRSEGWLLLIPWALWTLFRLPYAVGARRRLLFGAATCLAIVPLSVVVVNLTCLRAAPRWELFRADHVAIFWQWLHGAPADGETTNLQSAPPGASDSSTRPASVVGTVSPVTSSAAASPAAGTSADFDVISAAPNVSDLVLARKLAEQMVKAYTYVLGLLAVLGTIAYWRIYVRRDNLALLAMSTALLAMIWIRSAEHRNDPRYFFPIVLVSFPWMALGFLAVREWIARRLAARVTWTPARSAVLTGLLAVAVVVPCALEVKIPWGRFMESHRELGRWIADRYGPHCTIAANIEDLRLVAYYSQGQIVGRFRTAQSPGGPLPPIIADDRPRLVLIWFEPTKSAAVPERFAVFAAAVVTETHGAYRQVPAAELPPRCNDVIVLEADRATGAR